VARSKRPGDCSVADAPTAIVSNGSTSSTVGRTRLNRVLAISLHEIQQGVEGLELNRSPGSHVLDTTGVSPLGRAHMQLHDECPVHRQRV
jgi:hypothetical protein